MSDAQKATKAFDIKGLDSALEQAKLAGIVSDLEHEVQTDKNPVKLVPCREQECRRPIVQTTYYAPAKAICRSCKGETVGERQATVGQPVPGQTDPAKAVNLANCLVNLEFAAALCPVHPNDPEHIMELKSVNHSPHYGPGHFNGKGHWIQEAPGETAIHQCIKCLAVVSFTTTYRSPLRRQNAPKTKPDTGAPEHSYLHGIDGEIPPAGKMEVETA